MGSHRLDGGPSPVSPLWHCWDATLTLRCGCGRVEQRRPGELFSGQDRDTRLWVLVGRLRCRICGARPQPLGVRR